MSNITETKAMEQGTEDWFAARCGKVTASRIADVMAKIKTGEAASRRNYRAQIIAERLTGVVEKGFTNSHMERGTALEPFAREAYELHSGVIVEQIAFVDHPLISMTGASPDGLVGEDGLLEIKCPTPATHIEYILDDVVPSKYKQQMAWQKLCTGRAWIDFVSYCPEMPANLQLFVKRYIPEADYLAEVEAEVVQFNSEVDEVIIKLSKLGA